MRPKTRKTFFKLFEILAVVIATIIVIYVSDKIEMYMEDRAFERQLEESSGYGSLDGEQVILSYRPSLKTNELIVKATAYNPSPWQTDSTPFIAAWGDRVRPGIIAVSRDLEKQGLTRGKKVFVDGYGEFEVLDRMHKRKKNQIDIFMMEYKDAIQFGVKEVKITWREEWTYQETN